MSFSNFISKKIRKSKDHRFSKPIVFISIVSVALGVCVLILVFAVTTGFRSKIQEKVIGFGSHIEITYYDNNESYQKHPIEKNPVFLNQIKTLPNVKSMDAFAMKAGIIKTENEIEPIVLKGVEEDYNLDFFKKNLVKGKVFKLVDTLTSNEILISKTIADRLHLDINSKIFLYFVQDPPRQRVFKIIGIYKTDMTNFDKTIAICDLKHIQKLNDWTNNQVDGFEISLHNFNQLNTTNDAINNIIPYDLISKTVVTRNKEIFDWIGLFDQNILVLLILVIIVICISVISTQLTLILEQISTIGILKTMGCNILIIRNIFVNISINILMKGLLIGNGIGLLICFIQHKFHLFTLNPENYYMSYIPIDVRWTHLLLVNSIVIATSLTILLLSAYFVTKKIQIVDSIRFT